ncbi:MAG TPA: zf-HC2 domain-containing protein [Pyrinomonadaceae bacterium]|nr:zf-HC2 domain-containing protein [Pyrinomonadaceae bacterium]
MSCQETQQSLSLYVDDELALPVRAACDEHLRECPLCRAELAEMRAISRGLAALARPVPPPDLASSISDALEIEAAARLRQPVLPFSVKLTRWLRPRLMPYTVGSFASVLLFTMMFSALRPHMKALAEASVAAREADLASYKIIYIGTDGPDISQPITPELFAAQRAPVGDESPSLNPRGALAALTREQPRSPEEDEDGMIVVADVFSNGRASLADVVHPPRDRRMIDEFKDALRKNAAFVPAYYDRRPETMRVVFVVQKVDVPEQNF